MYIGLDIGGTYIKGVLAKSDGTVVNQGKINTGKSSDEINNNIQTLCTRLIEEKNVSRSDLKGLGVGSAGTINGDNGIIITSPNIPSWKNYPLAKELHKLLNIPVSVLNDATAALIGEWWLGNGKNFKNWIMLTLGTGIGGGAIINGELYTGSTGAAGEVGHMSIDYNGLPCACGNKGCFERYGSATAVVQFAKEELASGKESSINKRLITESLSAHLIQEEAVRGDLLAKEIFEKVGFFLGVGVSNLISIFNPEAVIFGGGLSHAHELLFPEIRKVIDERVLCGLKENVQLLVIKDEATAPALGAIKFAMDQQKNA